MNEELPGTVHLTVSLFLRLLEFAKEEARDDKDLHFIADNIAKLHGHDNLLDMKDYNHILQRG